MRRGTKYREMSGPEFLSPLMFSCLVLNSDPGAPLQNIRIRPPKYMASFIFSEDSYCSALT
jgi:hypothetical protein